MMNLNDTISAFRCCTLVPPRCSKCPLTEMCKWSLNKDRCKTEVKLSVNHWLTAQKPRVMTLEEAKSTYVIEYRSGKMREVGSALLDLNVDPLNAEYGKIYRVWTSRPTDAQREATPWDG